MFIIHRGAVNVQIREDGKVKKIRQLREGDFFGEMGLFTGEPRTATVVANEETEVSKSSTLPETDPGRKSRIGRKLRQDHRGTPDGHWKN